MRLTNEQIAELKVLSADLRRHAKNADDYARADRERNDFVSERMWKLEARELRRRARQHDEDIATERSWRRIERVRARLSITAPMPETIRPVTGRP